MKQHQRTEGKNDEWGTPPEIMTPLGKFDLDPCAFARPLKALARWNLALPFECGLKHDWSVGEFLAKDLIPEHRLRIWCNPPFNRYQRPKWMRKMSEHGNGIMLIPAATETKAFFDYVWEKAHAVCFLRGRPHFHYIDGTRAKANCGCSIALVAYGKENINTLICANLGRTLTLR